MAKRKPEEKREETRKQTTHRRRDAEANRKVLIGLIAVGAVLLLIIGAGLIQELLVKPGQPIATVNNARVTTNEYQKLVKYAWYDSYLQGQQLTDPQGSSVQVLDDAIDTELLREQAKQRNIVVTEDEINEAIEKRFGYLRVQPTPVPTATPDPSATPSTEPTPTPIPTATPVTLEAYQTAYKNYLERLNLATGLSEKDDRANIEASLLRQKLYEAIAKDVTTTAEQVRMRHILIAIRTPEPTPQPTAEATADPNATPAPTATPTLGPRDEAQALALAISIREKLAAGEDFASLAVQYSDDPGSKQEGGELGWFSKGQGLVQPFEDAAFKLEAGQISDPVKTDFGYHIIQVEERDPARELDVYSAAQKKYQAYQDWLTGLRNAAKIEKKWTLDKVPPTPAVGQYQ